MTRTTRMSGWRRWIGAGLLLLAAAAGGAEPRTTTRNTDKVAVTEPKPDVKVTRDVHDRYVRTTDAEGRWRTTQAGTETRATVTDWPSEWDDNQWETKAGVKKDVKLRTQAKTGNSVARELGKTRLDDPETWWEGEFGPTVKQRVKGKAGQVSVELSAGGKGSVHAGENGFEAKGQLGAEAEIQAATRKLAIGDKNAGASLMLKAKAQASVIAKGKLGAYVDEKGISFGVEGSVGAYVKGELKLNMEAHVFGVKTNVNLIASGYAGALAQGKAVVTLGWNGKVSFMASIGASLGFGGGVAVEFEMDAEELMKKLNLPDIESLLAWLKAFHENPKPLLAKLGVQILRKAHEAGFALLKKLGSQAASAFEHHVISPIRKAGTAIKEGISKGLAFLGRLIHSPRVEEGVAINRVLEQAGTDAGTLTDRGAFWSSATFPFLVLDNGCEAEMGEWEGSDPYAWCPFRWPSSYNWPSL